MSYIKVLSGLLLVVAGLQAQEVDPALLRLKQRMDSVTGFQAEIRMEVDISFVNMPVKHARVRYERGAPIEVTSEDFVMIPKRGLDITFAELFRHPFMTLNLGRVRLEGRDCEHTKWIPTSGTSEYAIATLWLDTDALQVLKSQISTKKHGEFEIIYDYGGPGELLPSQIRVEMAVSGMKIPLRFLGKDTQIDRDKMKEDPQQQGVIYLQLNNYQISRL